MAIIIQKVLNAVNVIDTKNESTKNIVASYSLNCSCSQDQLGKNIVFVGGTYPDRKEFEFYDIRYQDFGGEPQTWTGTIVELVNKINGEYFGFTFGLPTDSGDTKLSRYKQDCRFNLRSGYIRATIVGEQKPWDITNNAGSTDFLVVESVGGVSMAGLPLEDLYTALITAQG